MKKPPLRSFRVENFKAIRDSGVIKFGWLTAFIGNNGVGKSSLIEALETFRDVVIDGVDSAFQRWRGFEHVLNKARPRSLLERHSGRPAYTLPLKFKFHWSYLGNELLGQQTVTQGPGGNSLFIQREQIIHRRNNRTERWRRNDAGYMGSQGSKPRPRIRNTFLMPKLSDGFSMMTQFSRESLDLWQFLMLNPERMGQPMPQHQATSAVKLERDGSNVAEYLNKIREESKPAIRGILGALRYVLPYAADLQPVLTSELERLFYLKLNERPCEDSGLKEEEYEIPGWLLSTGTLRIVALLAALRHPNPPPLLVIEEIENGLDPRTLHLVVEEIRAAITAGTTQVIITTHSPYLLDLLDLSHIVVVDRKEGQPVFQRPDAEQLAEWSKSFSPGRLYTMGRLTGGSR